MCPRAEGTAGGLVNTWIGGADVAQGITPLDTPCLEWTGCRIEDGYGRKITGSRKGGRRLVLVHRWVWEKEFGPIPEGLCVLHRCDNPPCINLDHLFLGTLSDNALDRETKGRGRIYTGICPCGRPYTTYLTYRRCNPCAAAARRRRRAREKEEALDRRTGQQLFQAFPGPGTSS